MADDSLGYEDFEEEGAFAALPAQLRDPVRVLRRQLPWILVSLTLFLIVAAAVTAVFPLKYQARGTILLTEKSIPDMYVPTTNTGDILEQFEAIRGAVFSRDSMSKIISTTGLYAEEAKSLPIEFLAGRLANELTVETLPGRSGSRGSPHAMSFAISLTGEDPTLLAEVVNVTVSELIDANVEYRSRQARITMQFMQREFDRADEALRVHQRQLAQFRAQNRGGALPEEQDAALSKLERLEDQRRSAILQISDLRARLERIEARPQSLAENAELEALREKLQSARAIYTDDHPTVRSLERRLESLEARVGPQGSEGSTTDPSYLEEHAVISREIELEQARLTQIDDAVTQLEDRLSTAPEIAEQYEAMVREEKILQENYVDFLRKLKSAELALSLEHSQKGAQLTRLDTAIPPTAPLMPRWMVGVAGVVVSFGLAFAVGVGRELLSPVIIDEQHLEQVIPIPCLGSITEIA